MRWVSRARSRTPSSSWRMERSSKRTRPQSCSRIPGTPAPGPSSPASCDVRESLYATIGGMPKVRIIACGDALFSSRNLARRLPSQLVTLFQDADAVFANAEFCCPRMGTAPAPRRFITAVRPEVLDEFVELNVRLLSFANNHTGDFGGQ